MQTSMCQYNAQAFKLRTKKRDGSTLGHITRVHTQRQGNSPPEWLCASSRQLTTRSYATMQRSVHLHSASKTQDTQVKMGCSDRSKFLTNAINMASLLRLSMLLIMVYRVHSARTLPNSGKLNPWVLEIFTTTSAIQSFFSENPINYILNTIRGLSAQWVLTALSNMYREKS